VGLKEHGLGPLKSTLILPAEATPTNAPVTPQLYPTQYLFVEYLSADMFDLIAQESEWDVFPKSADLFFDDNDLLEESKTKRFNGRKGHPSAHRWSDAEIRVLLTALAKNKYMTRDELALVAAEMRQGNTPSSVTKWFKSCRATQSKVGKQERSRRRDARYTKAK